MKKRFTSVLMAVVVLTSTVLTAVSAGSADELSALGYISYADTLLPTDGEVTRGEFAATLNSVFGFFTTLANSFSDADISSPHHFDMMAAKTAGYLYGYDDGTGRPGEVITRLEAAVILQRVCELPDAGDITFADRDEIPEWANGAAARAVLSGYMPAESDENGNLMFLPDRPLTRGEMYDMMIAAVKTGRNTNRIDTVMSIPSYDGYGITGRLSIPSDGDEMVDKLVIFVNGSGPNTYENRRQNGDLRFKYFDYFADVFAENGIAFFSYNTRGVYETDEYPFYRINYEEYLSYLPMVQAKDLGVMISELKRDERLKDASVHLLGWSEGAVVAPLAALETDIEIDSLILAGYPNENMLGILNWQLTGRQTYFYYTIILGVEGSESITKEQFEADPYGAVKAAFGNLKFEDIDVDSDGLLTVNDFLIIRKNSLPTLLTAIDDGDYERIKSELMIELTPEWFKAHFELGKTEDILARIEDIPIHIFHGTWDLNCPVEGVYDLRDRFAEMGKTNLTVNIFQKHDHNLNFDSWLLTGTMSEGIAAIVETVKSLP